MKLTVFSDGHGLLPIEIAKADVLCICGDITPATNHDVTYQKEWVKDVFIPWAYDLLKNDIVKDIIFIAGNHDWLFEEMYTLGTEESFRNKLPKHIHYLRDSSVTIDGVKFYGTPWQPEFFNWAFNLYEGELDKKFEIIPNDTDIILSHGPAYGFNDRVEGRSGKLGSKALAKHLYRVKPLWLFCGHIHTGSHTPTVLNLNNNSKTTTSIVNVSIIDEDYQYYKPPFETVIGE